MRGSDRCQNLKGETIKILLVSHQYEPSVGGIETISSMLVEGFIDAGHTVTVVTQTPGDSNSLSENLRVMRGPGAIELLKAVKFADVVFHNNISLRFAWPLALVWRPWVVAVHIWITRMTGSTSLVDHAKQFVLKFANVISVSQAVADHLLTKSRVIPNAYRSDLFRKLDGVEKIPRSIVFVGRLIPDKGVETLLRAAALLHSEGLLDRLTIIGDGRQREDLEVLAADLEIHGLTHFTGQLSGQFLVEQLNSHEFMVIPSRWDEPFGLVALEGIACGCIVVGTSGGGLPEAIGRAGRIFQNGNEQELFEVLKDTISDSSSSAELLRLGPEHLSAHTPARMVADYLEVLETARARFWTRR